MNEPELDLYVYMYIHIYIYISPIFYLLQDGCNPQGGAKAKQLTKYMTGAPPINHKFSQFLLNDRPGAPGGLHEPESRIFIRG